MLPAGARIYTNGQTNNLPTSEGKTFNINLGGVTVRSEADARRLGDILRDQLVMAGPDAATNHRRHHHTDAERIGRLSRRDLFSRQPVRH